MCCVNLVSLRRRSGKGQAGFTLIEVFVALFIFSIAALAVAAMTFMSIRGNAMTNQMSQATFLAQDKMEELLAFPNYTVFGAAVLAASSDSVAADRQAGQVYARNWTATCAGGPPPPANTNPPPSSCWVTVNVSWRDANGTHQVVVRSLWRGV